MAPSSSSDVPLSSFATLGLEAQQQEWRRRLKTEPPHLRSAPLLAQALAYRLQARARGGLKPSVRRRLEDLAVKFAAEPRYAPAPLQSLRHSTVLIRDWQGKRYGVTVTHDGFLFNGATYASLSAVATAITGVKRNGPLFFGLNAPATAETQP